MSGPVTVDDVPAEPGTEPPEACEVEVTESHVALVGDMQVRRALPRRGRRTVGAWCFADHMGPATVSPGAGIDVGPHPHIGLQTVTWLTAGEILHRDSLGSEQLVRPGQLNLMTAGRGVSHSEEGTSYAGRLEGVQFWVAQPGATRDGDPDFEHHPELPEVELDEAVVTVFVGELGGVASPARRDTDHIGLDLRLRPGTSVLPLEPTHEYALIVVEGAVQVGGVVVEPGHLAYLGTGRSEGPLTVAAPSRAMLIGGVPFPEPVLMWWNYVARTREEVDEAHRAWSSRSDRFGVVRSPLPRIDVGPPPWRSEA
jgi:redox-sensitive bicupin YhaK (pirin superfamily)